MKKLMLAVLFYGVCVNSSYSGGWGSSGGGQFKDDLLNPWFAKNTKTVQYCIDIDPEGFSGTRAEISKLLPMAFAYWKNEFADETTIGLGKQNFVETQGSCTGSEDIRFEFGYGALKPDQLSEFAAHDADPQDFVAITIRPDYDKVQLRGKGYVFVASDFGPHPYGHGQVVATNLWQHEGVLYRVLVHETGHIFGVTHTPGEPMGDDYPEQVLHHYSDFREIGTISPFFRPTTNYEFCGSDSNSINLPGLPPGTQCVRLSFSKSFDSVQVSAKSISGASTTVGNFSARGTNTLILGFPLKIYFPKEQQVFDVMPGERLWNGPSRQSVTAYVDLPKEFQSTGLLFDLNPGSIRVHSAAGVPIFLLGGKNGHSAFESKSN